MILARSVKQNFPAVENVMVTMLQLLSAANAKMATTVRKHIFQFLIVPNVHKLNAKNVKAQKSVSNALMGIFCPKNLILSMEPSSHLMHSA
jgi:hypothetical protein